MTENEFKTIFGIIVASYDSFKADKYKMAIWYAELKDIPYKVLESCVRTWVSTNKWAPTIADLRETALKMSKGEDDWGKGWEEVLKAIRKFGYTRPEEAYASMSEITEKAARRIGFVNICMSENIAADRANFRDIYNLLSERKKKDDLIPSDVKALINKAFPQIEEK